MLRSTTNILIGLEVHLSLNTPYKLYSPSLVGHTHPIDLGCPGTLPSPINIHALQLCTQLALLLKCDMASHFKAARKVYRYIDLPKGYQITQQDPLGINGRLRISDTEVAIIKQVHMEEDAARITKGKVLYDRAGNALAEVVTQPCFTTIDQAVAFLRKLRSMCIRYSIAKCRMELGEMRVDVNLSCDGGARSEIKNLNSFNNIRSAINYELEHHPEPRDSQVTLSFNDHNQTTSVARFKEQSDDYLYIDDPDIVETLLPIDLCTSNNACRAKRIEQLYKHSLSNERIDKLASVSRIDCMVDTCDLSIDNTMFFNMYFQVIHNTDISCDEIVIIYKYFIEKKISKEHVKTLLTDHSDVVSVEAIESLLHNAHAKIATIVRRVINQYKDHHIRSLSDCSKSNNFLIGRVMYECRQQNVTVDPQKVIALIHST